ncbi:hypothetical protein C5O00_04210 [Pukyongia salina]|uniref:Uncharacterized protein n=1 Tax=Pukyongia salina TaxID=2094025 RepID=A0A2S0HUX1_9FLAO|nr:hypothetical protein [Pukyongia salina]AVI50408.1 hypothetical protein C5O00_04210 [Pukyongia salina]
MKHKTPNWTKHELQIYIMLLAAQIDKEIDEEELSMIRSKTDEETFEKMYGEFKKDSNKKRLAKIRGGIDQHEYSHMELVEFRKEISEIFLADNKFKPREQHLDRILDNILY